MNSLKTLPCDGCGQPASSDHLAARLQRLEWATRFRPVHIGVLFLGAAAPAAAGDYLYAGAGNNAQGATESALTGEGRHLLDATGLLAMAQGQAGGRAAALAEFQHRGYFLTHVLECPSEITDGPGRAAMESQLPLVLARMRRSLRPKRIAVIAQNLDVLLPRFAASELGATLLLDGGKAFALDAGDSAAASARLREALAGNSSGTR
jgi:hypothetical protein